MTRLHPQLKKTDPIQSNLVETKRKANKRIKWGNRIKEMNRKRQLSQTMRKLLSHLLIQHEFILITITSTIYYWTYLLIA